MNKVNAIQQAVSEYEDKIDETNKKCQALSEEYAKKIKFVVEKEVNAESKLTVNFGIEPPFERSIFLRVRTEHSSGGSGMALSADEGQALYEILKELYE